MHIVSVSRKEKRLRRKHGALGGKTAAANMTAAERRARALKAVRAREAKRKLKQQEK